MDREPNTNGFKIAFENGVEIYCYPNNTMAFLHEQEPYGDHLFVFKVDEKDEVTEGDYVFREQIDNFDQVVEMMTQRGFNIIPSDNGRLRDHDREAYEEFLFRKKPVDLPETPLTERQERFMQYFAHILLKNHLTPDEFRNVNGDLFL